MAIAAIILAVLGKQTKILTGFNNICQFSNPVQS